MTRDEHLAWCKERALEYLQAGELQDAIASMLSDLNKHPDTAPLVEATGPLAAFEMMNPTPGGVRRFIEGYQ